MAVKILIKRKVMQENDSGLMTLLNTLRSLTLTQEGYISGETLKRIDHDNDCMVISTWRSKEDWDAWFNNAQRMKIQSEIDGLLGEQTEYAIYKI